MRTLRAFGVVIALLAIMLLVGLSQAAQKAEFIHEDNHGLSAPVRNMPIQPASGAHIMRDRLQIPGVHPVASPVLEDAALQETAFPLVNATTGLAVQGLGVGFPGFTVHYAPPDTNAAVGDTQLAETVNLQYAVFNKSTGAVQAGPTNLSNLWTGVDANCSSANLSDPVVMFDHLADRWVIQVITTGSPSKICIAVSSSSDATGTYHSYAFTDTAGLPDYPKLGQWPDAYYTTVRQFNSNGTAYFGPKACASDRTAMLAGSAATMQCIQISSTSVDGMLPADWDGDIAPPAGSPNYMLLIPLPDSGQTNKLQLYQFHYVGGGGSTLTGPVNITVNGFKEASSFGGFVPQLGTTTKLDGTGFTLMHRLSYRNFPNGATPHEALLVTHSVSVGTGSTLRYAPRWYEIRSPGTTPVVYQQGTYSPDTTTWRWCGSIAMDKVGNIALGYSASSATINPGIRFTGRNAKNPLGKMQAEATLVSGTGSQTGNLYRWGDYSSMVLDPVDDCTFWYTTEYIPSNGSFNWATKLSSFKFPNCN